MKCTNATKFHRKSGVAKWRACPAVSVHPLTKSSIESRPPLCHPACPARPGVPWGVPWEQLTCLWQVKDGMNMGKRCLQSRPRGPSAKRQPSPEGLGIQRQPVERRRCGTTLFVCSLGAQPDFLFHCSHQRPRGCARGLRLPIHLTVCFEAGRFTLTQSSWTASARRCSCKWMSGHAGKALVLISDRGQPKARTFCSLGEPAPPGQRESPFPLDHYLSWMTRISTNFFRKPVPKGTEESRARHGSAGTGSNGNQVPFRGRHNPPDLLKESLGDGYKGRYEL